MNQRPSGYEPDELPSCSTPRYIFQLSLRALYHYITIFSECQVFFKKSFNKILYALKTLILLYDRHKAIMFYAGKFFKAPLPFA